MASKAGSGNIKVGVRLRPMIAREENEALRWKMQGNRVSRFDLETNKLTNPLEFDHVYGDGVNNEDIFKSLIVPLVQKAVKGFNATILAYGQTSSGKTHTMMGSDDDRGIIPLTMEYIFEAIDNLDEERSFLLGISFMEVYNEKVRDLLNIEKSDLKVYETPDGSINTDCSVEMVNCAEQMIRFMQQGNKNKSIGETNMNDRSSRSHTIFRITIESEAQGKSAEAVSRVSQINLVDLAGSERASQTGTTGQRYKEGCAINKSLLQLGNVVQRLSEDKGEFIDYRSSKLTRILQPSLSGNANIVMICNITPYSADQTANTLLFASRASTIKLDPHLNEFMDDATLLKRHAKKITELEQKVKDSSKLVEKNEHLQKEIEFLTGMLVKSRLQTLHPVDKRNLRRRTWGGDALGKEIEPDDVDLRLRSEGLDVLKPMPNLKLVPIDIRIDSPDDHKKISLPETITVRNDDFDDSVCMSIDEGDGFPPFLRPSVDMVTPPSKLRAEIIHLRTQLAEKAAATPALRRQISTLEQELEQREKELEGGPKSILLSKIQQLEEERVEMKPDTPVPKLRERIKVLEEELENEHSIIQSKENETHKLKENLQKVEEELHSKTEALQQKTKEFELFLKERSSTVETPGTPAAALHGRIKNLQEQSSQLTGTPPAQLRKKICKLEEECKYVETELSELREFTTLEKQMIAEGKVEELQLEMKDLKKTLEDYENVCTDLRKQTSELSVRNEELSEMLCEKTNNEQSLAKELETNRAWNSKANEQQLIWKKDLISCKNELEEMKNKCKDWMDEKEIMKSRYELKIKELTSSLQEAWSSGGSGDSVPASPKVDTQSNPAIEEMQRKIDELQKSLNEAQSSKADEVPTSVSMNTSCQTDHDMEELGHHATAIKELQDKLEEAETQLAAVRNKIFTDSGCQTDHDDEHLSDKQNLMTEIQSILDSKNSISAELEAVSTERDDLKQTIRLKVFEYEGLQAEIDDVKQKALEDLNIQSKKLDELWKQKEEDNAEHQKAVSAYDAKNSELALKVKDLSDQISQLEANIDSQEELQEKMFFISQENDNLRTQLEYKQESINFNMTEIERLKGEICQTKSIALQEQPEKLPIASEFKDLSEELLELQKHRDEIEESKKVLEMRVVELESKIASFERTTEEEGHDVPLLKFKKENVFEFQHDSFTLIPSNEVEEKLRQEIAMLQAKLAERDLIEITSANDVSANVEQLEKTRHELSQTNHELEEKLAQTLDQLNQNGLLPELASQVTLPSPDIEKYISLQIDVLQKSNNELEAQNEELKIQLENFKKKNEELSTLLENMSESNQDDAKEFVALLEKQVQEMSGHEAKSTNLKDLHAELLAVFMARSQEVCSDLHKEIKRLEEKSSSYKQRSNEQTELVVSLEATNAQLREALNTTKLSEDTAYKTKLEEQESKIAGLESDLEEYRKAIEEMQNKSEVSQHESMMTMNGKELELTLKLNETKDCLDMAVTEERQMRTKIAEREEELAAVLEEKAKLFEQYNAVELKSNGLQAILDETMKIAEETKERCAELEVELLCSKEKINELEHTLDVTEKASAADSASLAKIKKDLDKCKKELAEAIDQDNKTSEELMNKLSEIDELVKRENALKNKIEELEKSSGDSDELLDLRSKLAQFEELQSKAAEVEELRSRFQEMEEFRKKAEELPTVKAQLERLEESRAVELEELEKYKNLAAEAENLQGNIQELQHLVKSKQDALEDLENRVSEVDVLRKQLTETEQAKSMLEEELASIKCTVSNTSTETENLKIKISELEFALDEANKNIEARVKYAENLEQELAAAKEARSFLDRSSNITTDLHLTLDNRNMEQMLALESLNSNLKSELRNMTEDYERLSSEKSGLDEKVNELQDEIESLKGKATGLKNQLVQLAAKDAKSLELVSGLRSEISQLKEANDNMQHELDFTNAALMKEQELVKTSLVNAEAQIESKQFSLQGEVHLIKEKLQQTEKSLQQMTTEKENLKVIFDKKTADLTDLQSKHSQLVQEQERCWRDLQTTRQDLEFSRQHKSELENNLAMYRSNLDNLRASISSSGSASKQRIEDLESELIKINNEKYEVELQLNEKCEFINDLEAKITNTNTILNRVSGERDVFTIKMQEMKAELGKVTEERNELSEKCKETDSDYEELLTVYRVLENKSKEFETQAIKLRKEKTELTTRLKTLEDKVGTLGAVDHSSCQQTKKELEKKLAEKNQDVFDMKRELSLTRGELLHLKLTTSNQPGVLDNPEVYKDQIKKLESKITLYSKEIEALTTKLNESQNKGLCKNCLPKVFPLEAGVQAVPMTQDVSSQAPSDNNVLFDPVQGYTPESAIIEASRMFGMSKQVQELTAKVEELTTDRKLFKDVLRKRLLTIRTLEAQVNALNAKANTGQENKGIPLTDKN